MKRIIYWLTASAVILTLQACVSTSRVLSETAMLPPQPAEAHQSELDDVPAYINEFKEKYKDLTLEINNQKYDFSFMDRVNTSDSRKSLLILEYESGIVLVGFNNEKEELAEFLQIREGDTSDLQAILDNPDRLFVAQNIHLKEQNGNAIYVASLTDNTTQESYNLRLVINESLVDAGNSTLEVKGTSAEIIADNVGAITYIQVQALITDHPEVDTLILKNIGGSLNDAINMHTGRLIREAGLTTRVPADGEIRSGGVDLFSSGLVRQYETGSKIGVHAWCCTEDGKTADKLSRNHNAHNAQLIYFREMLGTNLGAEFYFFTIEAAPFDDIHLMTQEETEHFLLN